MPASSCWWQSNSSAVPKVGPFSATSTGLLESTVSSFACRSFDSCSMKFTSILAMALIAPHRCSDVGPLRIQALLQAVSGLSFKSQMAVSVADSHWFFLLVGGGMHA